jgi:hypothetical protein
MKSTRRSKLSPANLTVAQQTACLWNPNFHCHVYNISLLSQLNPVQPLTSYLFIPKTYFEGWWIYASRRLILRPWKVTRWKTKYFSYELLQNRFSVTVHRHTNTFSSWFSFFLPIILSSLSAVIISTRMVLPHLAGPPVRRIGLSRGLSLLSTTHKADIFILSDWESNPRSKCSNGWTQYAPYTVRPLRSFGLLVTDMRWDLLLWNI